MIKKIFYAICIASFIINIQAQERTKMQELNSIISEIKNEYSKDKRTSIFELNVVRYDDLFSISGMTNLPDAKNELLKRANEKGIIITDKIELLPVQELGNKIYGIINLSVANFRTKPEHDQELSTQALLGTPIKVYKKDASGYLLVQTPDNYISFLDDDGFELMTKEEFDDWNKSKKIFYLEEYGFSYSEPDDNSERVSDLVIGNILKFVERIGEYIKVQYPDGRIAYVKTNECADYEEWLNELNITQESIISTAKKFMGIPYLWGGTSSKTMDCSGFTKMVYYLHGIILERDASLQVHTGDLVDTKNGFENLQPGDLMFFGSKSVERERITHVAIYIGDLEFIHASGRVRINSFDKNKENFSPYRLKQFIRAKRILTSIDKNGITTIRSNKFYRGEF
ncbi:MAG: C40 family peptidase [Ignavibacteriales bacterium]|nr:C40 family peptidase [Ignavibacteriales bacterium]